MAAGNIKGITIEIGGDVTKLDKALSEVNKNTKSLQSELAQVEKLLKLDPKNTELLAQKQELLKKSVSETSDKLDTLKIAEKQVQEQFAKGEVSEEQYRGLQREIASTESQLEKLTKEAKNSNSSLGSIGETADKLGTASTNLGKKLAPVSAAAAAIGTAAVASAMALDDGYDTIITKTGATGEALDGLTEVANDIFANMPTTMDDVGTAVGEVSTRFGATGDELENLSSKFIKFAEINNSDLNTSISTTNKIMEQWNVPMSDTGNLLGLITKKSQDTGISVDTLMESVQTNGATFKEMGLNLTQSIGLLADFEANGVNADTAMAGLKKSVQNYTAQGKSADEALQLTIDSIKNAGSETEALTIATDIFGKKGATEMTRAIREGRLSIDDLSASMDGYGSVVEDTFAATLDPWDDAKVALNNLKLAGADLGQSILSSLQPTITGIVEKVKEFTGWFKSLDDSQKKTIVTILAIVASIAPMLLIFGKICTTISTIINLVKMAQTAIGILNAVLAANPIILIVLAIAALIAAFILLYNNCEWFRNAVNAVFEQVKQFVGVVVAAVGGFILSIWETLQLVWGFIQPFLQAAWDIIKSIWDAVVPYFGLIWDSIKAIFVVVADVIGGYFSVAWSVVKGVWDIVVAYFQMIWDNIQLIFSVVGDILSGDFQGAWDGICAIFGNVGEFFGTVWNTIVGIFGGVAGWFGTVFTDAWNAVKSVFSTGGKIFDGIKEGIADTFKTIVNGLIGGINKVISFPFDKINGLLNTIRNVSILGVSPFSGLWEENPLPVPNIPMLAKGGTLRNGEAIVAEAGPELLQMVNGKTVVTPLSNNSKNTALDKLAEKTGNNTKNEIQLKIENFYNNREQDIRELTEEILEVAQSLKEREDKVYA